MMKVPQGFNALAIIALFAFAPQPAHAVGVHAPFSIADAISAPLAFDLTAAPSGGRFAWYVDAQGVRNIWFAEPSANGFSSRQITHYASDDGYELRDISWTPKADDVVYARGGMLDEGPPANFLARPAGMPAREIWVARLAGGSPHLVGDGYAPTVSPRSNTVAFLDAGKIMIARLNSNRRASTLLEDIGIDSDLAWSPDGSRIAFVSQRRDHNIIGVYDFNERSVTWIAPSFDQDSEPTWSPDGRQLAFIRQPTQLLTSCLPRPVGYPWSIWVADADGSNAHAAFTADMGPGSVFFGLDTGTQDLFWASEDRIVFPWEKTGWVNLYIMPAAGGTPRPVASGAFEVFAAALIRNGSAVVFSANRGNLDARRLWLVSLNSRTITELDDGHSFQDKPELSSDARTIAFMEGDAWEPFRPVSFNEGSETPIPSAAAPPEFPGAAFVRPIAVTFPSTDGVIIHAQYFERSTNRATPGPAILFFHGGPQRQLLPGWDEIRFYAECYAMNQYLASEGYTVLSVNYRGGTGYGLAFREAAGFGPGGATETRDIAAAARWLGRQPGVDPRRIGIYGASYGGVMTADGLALYSNLLAAGVDYAGVHDWLTIEPDLASSNAPAGTKQTAWRSSALSHVSTWRSPVLIVHSDDDRDVDFEQSEELLQALRARHVPLETLVIPNEVHDLRLHRSWLIWLEATDGFFARRLAR